MRISDWSSDVCSSDLPEPPLIPGRQEQLPEARHLRRPHRETQSPRSRRRSPRIPQACNLQLCSSSSSQIDILETYLEILNIEIHGGAHRHSRTGNWFLRALSVARDSLPDGAARKTVNQTENDTFPTG